MIKINLAHTHTHIAITQARDRIVVVCASRQVCVTALRVVELEAVLRNVCKTEMIPAIVHTPIQPSTIKCNNRIISSECLFAHGEFSLFLLHHTGGRE